MPGAGEDMTAKSACSQWPDTIRMAFGFSPISAGMRASEAASVFIISAQSGSQGQGPPPWEMK